MPTDENVFRDPISRLYVINPVNSKALHNEVTIEDSIHVGDLIIRVNDKKIDSLQQLTNAIFYASDTTVLKLQIACVHRKEIRDHLVLKKDIPKRFFVELKSSVLVTNVTEGGASDRAGLMVGDIITRINGKTFNNALEADLALRALKANNSFTYQILRDGKLIDLNIRLAKYGITFSMLFFFVSGFLMLGTGLFFGISRPQLIAARLASLALIFIGFSITGRLNPTMHYIVESNWLFITLLLITNAVLVFCIAIFIHSLYYFPVDRSSLIKKHRWIVIVPYSYATLAFALICYGVFNNYLGVNFSLFATLFVVVGFISFIIFTSIKFRNKSLKDRRISRAIYFSLTINLIYLGLLPVVTYFGVGGYFLMYLNIIMALIPLAYIYTVARYRLLDLDFRLRKNNQYLILVSLWKFILLFIFFAFIWFISHIDLDLPNIHFTGTSIEVINRPLKQESLFFYNTFVGIVASLIFAYFLVVTYRSGIAFFNKKYFRPKFDYKHTAFEISEVLDKNVSLNNLLEAILKKLKEAMLLRNAGMIVFEPNGTISGQYYCELKDEGFSDKILAKEAELIEKSRSITDSFRTEYLSGELKDIIIEESFYMIIPIHSKGDAIGIILLGDKLSETPINNEDVLFVHSFIAQVVVAIENANLYKDLAKKERMKHELDLARKIQKASLPKFKPKLKGLEVAAVSIPAYEVGGDFYDYLNECDNELTVIIGDVSGKGASAALYMSKAQGIMRTLAEFFLSPFELLARTNKLLHKHIDRSSFISVITATFDVSRKKMVFARAGHLPLFMYQAAEKQVIEIQPKGLILGASPDNFFREHLEQVEVEFCSGDIFLFATDGAVETRRNGDEFGTDRLKALLSHFKYLSAEDLIEQIIIEINRFSDTNSPGDDLTLIIVKVT